MIETGILSFVCDVHDSYCQGFLNPKLEIFNELEGNKIRCIIPVSAILFEYGWTIDRIGKTTCKHCQPKKKKK